MFQSLLFWKSYCNLRSSISSPQIPRMSFNPCYSGSLTVTATPVDAALMLTGFNPCYSGSLTVTLNSIRPVVDSVGFNPCYSGSLTVTQNFRHNDERKARFNPCYSGSLTVTMHTCRQISVCLCVSILVILEVLL